MLLELTWPADSVPMRVSATPAPDEASDDGVDDEHGDGCDRGDGQERGEEGVHVGLREHDEEQERREDEEGEAAEHVPRVRTQQIDASEDPAQCDRDAHHDEPGERVQHPSSLLRSARTRTAWARRRGDL